MIRPDDAEAPGPTSGGWNEIIRDDLAALERSDLRRSRRVLRPIDAVHAELDGRRVINFASNNYLGLTHHPSLISAAIEATHEFGTGSGAASLISGYTSIHRAAELEIALWKKTAAALLLPSGYQANVAAVQSIAGMATSARPVRFLLDRLSHASLIDAVRASGAPYRIYPHDETGKLERLLADAPDGQLQAVVTESVFSMDGDRADLASLVRLKEKFPFLLVLDEAHASGVYGPSGEGWAAEQGFGHAVDVSILTLSKALGSSGGAICASRGFCDAVLNRGRAAIYTTNVSPATAAIARAAVRVVLEDRSRRERLRLAAQRVRAALGREGDVPIIPIILQSESAALRASDELLKRGLLVSAVRPPSVPRGTSRLRVTLSSEHSPVELDLLISSLLEICPAEAVATGASARRRG